MRSTVDIGTRHRSISRVVSRPGSVSARTPVLVTRVHDTLRGQGGSAAWSAAWQAEGHAEGAQAGSAQGLLQSTQLTQRRQLSAAGVVKVLWQWRYGYAADVQLSEPREAGQPAEQFTKHLQASLKGRGREVRALRPEQTCNPVQA